MDQNKKNKSEIWGLVLLASGVFLLALFYTFPHFLEQLFTLNFTISSYSPNTLILAGIIILFGFIKLFITYIKYPLENKEEKGLENKKNRRSIRNNILVSIFFFIIFAFLIFIYFLSSSFELNRNINCPKTWPYLIFVFLICLLFLVYFRILFRNYKKIQYLFLILFSLLIIINLIKDFELIKNRALNMFGKCDTSFFEDNLKCVPGTPGCYD